MEAHGEMLEGQVAGLLGWEKRKRREAALIAALSYAFLVALAAPLFVSIPPGWAWAAPAACFAVLTPCLLYTRRWRGRDTVRALAALDRTLKLDERATTAWELVRRNDTKAVARLVLRQASERLQGVDPRALFPRTWDRHVFVLPVLLALWLALNLFEARFQHQGAEPAQPASLAQELRELARRLQEKAGSEGLPQALKAGRELERIAQRAIDAATTDEEFKNELAGIRRKLAAERNAAGPAPFGAAESRRELEDLRAEVEAAREMTGATGGEGESWQEQLAGLSQLQKQWQRQEQGAGKLDRDGMQAFLDKLGKRVAAELDRRALMETEQALQQMARRGQSRDGDAQARAGRSGEQEGPGEGRRDRNAASAAGKEPAAGSGGASPPPEVQDGARSRLQGVIGKGVRSSIQFKGKPVPGRSELTQDEVLAGYRRQAEAELDTEKIPGELKDAIRAYFLSLDKSK